MAPGKIFPVKLTRVSLPRMVAAYRRVTNTPPRCFANTIANAPQRDSPDNEIAR